jgi:hypothetical protein
MGKSKTSLSNSCMPLQSCKIYIEGHGEDMDKVTNVICSFAEESKVNDDIKHIKSHHIKHIQEINMAHTFMV